MNTFSRSSVKQLSTCHPVLKDAAHFAISVTDFGVICGHRNREDQNEAYATDRSTVQWPNGKHNSLPSLAFDLVPYHTSYGHLFGDKPQLEQIAKCSNCSEAEAHEYIWQRYAMLHGVLKAYFIMKQVPFHLRWGGDWNSDDMYLDQSFHDLGHWELAPRI